MLRFFPAAGFAVLLLAGAPHAHAHARLKPSGSIPPRSDSSSLKSAPCGNVAPTTDPAKRTELTAGQDLIVEWEESVDHPGSFRIAFSKDGTTGFDDGVLLDQILDDQNGSIEYGNPATWHQFSATVKVPGTNCESCSIQLIQVMTDHNPPTFYYSCADVRISGAVEEPEPTPPPPSPPPAGPEPTPATPPAPAPASPAEPGAPVEPSATEPPAMPPVAVPTEPVVPLAPTGLRLEIRLPKGAP